MQCNPKCAVLSSLLAGAGQWQPTPAQSYTGSPCNSATLALLIASMLCVCHRHQAAHTCGNMRRLDLEEFGGSTIVNNEGFAPAVATFMLAWIGTYTMLHS